MSGTEQASGNHRAGWLLSAVVWPFLVTRGVLFLVGWFSTYFEASRLYHPQEAVTRGWRFTPDRWLDIWARFDTGGYLNIIQHGYVPPAAGAPLQNEWALFPLYPMICKLIAAIVPGADASPERLIAICLLVSNLALIGALVLLYRLSLRVLGTHEAAERTNWYLLLSPPGFYFSAAYTESTFLLLSVAVLLAASRERWASAALLAAFLTATRPLGVMIGVPLLLLYLRSVRWRLSAIRPAILWLCLVPAGIAAHLLYCYLQTGDFLAPVHVQTNWGRETSWPWESLLNPTEDSRYVNMMDRIVTLSCLALSFLAIFRLPPGYGLYGLLLLLPPLCTGSLLSITRYCVVAFPAFMMLAILSGRFRHLDPAVRAVLMALQIVLFVAWCRFYWVG